MPVFLSHSRWSQDGQKCPSKVRRHDRKEPGRLRVAAHNLGKPMAVRPRVFQFTNSGDSPLNNRPPIDDLPIDEVISEIIAGLAAGNVVLRAPPGAGKTTRVPPAILRTLSDSAGRIILVQPRRLAARTAARRIAHELDVRVGNEVGYAVRFDSRFTSETRILAVTDGVLLRMLQDDPLLEEMSVIVFDEFHERSLNVDLALAMVTRVQTAVRPDLKIVVMSATLDPGPITNYLAAPPHAALPHAALPHSNATSVECQGRSFPIDVRYLPRRNQRSRIVDLTVEGVESIIDKSTGDILVFLPGVGEIRQAESRLEHAMRKKGIVVQTLYGSMPPEQQDEVIHRLPQRRIILATNVAETSVTIHGIECVVDSGWVRQLKYDVAVGLDRLELTPISKASADQRAGRAGRLGPGICLRLWEKSAHGSRPDFETPEVKRGDLSAATLQLRCWGERDLEAFPWFEHPDQDSIQTARETLTALGALEGEDVTPLGKSMGRLPLAPRLARLVLEGYRQNTLRRATIAAALISERDPFERQDVGTIRGERQRKSDDHESNSDILDRVEAIEEFQFSGTTHTPFGNLRSGATHHMLKSADQYLRAVEQMLGPCDEAESEAQQEEGLLRALLAAYSDRLARRRGPRDPRAVLGRGRGVRLDRGSRVLGGEFFVCVDVDGRKSEATVRQASIVREEWLEEQFVREEEALFFHPTQKRVAGRRSRFWGGLLLDEKSLNISPSEESARLLETAARQAWRQVFPQKDRALTELLLRARWLRTRLEQAESLPSWEESDLQDSLGMLCQRCLSIADLAKTDWLGMLLGQLSYEQRKLLDEAAPEHLTTPSGRKIRLRYQADKPPIMEVRIQEMFGVMETPRVALGRVPVLLHLLAPNNRPQQITDDLASFWKNTYPQVRKDLRGRYSKHAWPEDPFA